MNKRNRFLSLFVAVVLLLACAGMSATAFADGVKPRRITLRPGGERTLDEGRTLQFSYEIQPADADTDIEVSWSTSNSNVAEVDDSGWVTAVGPGTATITAKTKNNQKATVTIRVPGKLDEDLPRGWTEQTTTEPTEGTEPPTKAVTAPTKPAATEATEKAASKSALLAAVSEAGGKTAILKGYTTVSAADLQAVAKESKSSLRFDTVLNKAVTGCVTINPANAAKLSGDLSLGVYASGDKTKKVQERFAKHYRNNLHVLYCDQASFGMTVTIRAKVGDFASDDLRLYLYDQEENAFQSLSAKNASIDKNGYLKFPTKTGGFIVVSDGPLTAK